MATNGKIGVTTENIFPVIKKFLTQITRSSFVSWWLMQWMLLRR